MRVISIFLNIGTLITGLGMLAIGLYSLYSFSFGAKNDVAYYQNYLENGVETIGILSKDFDSTHVKLKSIEFDLMSTEYEYFVDGRSYTDKFSFSDMSEIEEDVVPVHYLPSKPEDSCVNAVQKLEEAKEEVGDKFSLYLGLAFTFVGLLLTYLSVNRIRRAFLGI